MRVAQTHLLALHHEEWVGKAVRVARCMPKGSGQLASQQAKRAGGEAGRQAAFPSQQLLHNQGPALLP